MNNQIKNNFDLLHDIAPGKHFYQFYKNPDDLLKILLPYWQAGVSKKHYCFWSLPSFLTLEQGKNLLVQAIPEIDQLIREGSFEIVAHDEWYGNGEDFDIERMLLKYERKMKEALKDGYSVFRLSGDMSGFLPSAWPLLKVYEQKGHSMMHALPCIALCSYPLHELKLQQTKDVLDSHHGVLVAKV